MATPTAQTVKTQFVTSSSGIKFAYRRLGPSNGVPLLFLHHFRGTIDHWDPLLVNTIATKRPVILFDNAGIGHSTGPVDNTMLKMAQHVIEFLSLLSITEVDLLGFSQGGIVAPLVFLHANKGLVRKLILTGTQPTAGEGVREPEDRENVFKTAGQPTLTVDAFLWLFFGPSAASQAAGRAWWSRIHERTKETSGEDRVGYVSEGLTEDRAGVLALVEAFTKADDRAFAAEGSYDRLGEIDVPVLIANGHDVMIHPINSYVLWEKIPNAHLQLFPDSGHGFLFQFAEVFARRVEEFLDSW
ncbi:hypothetical protein B7494_g654 [Chlorociboria aeruginascens]|nr:hypothetical protein B7494_g654 [Chlorociboria aeruginascens]